ncbi:hypothetical protein [Bdellovibrio sp. HCB2-146]|uniref:hypothetical protein n=1 Tax=Bdellovibrio sp. HCB2-146 TaxID=3394362 RepID=UPI0039BC962C
MKNLAITFLLMFVAGAASAQVLRVEGERGKFQVFAKVKAVRCSAEERGKCDAPIYFNLNESKNVPAGNYILGFENSIYPEVVSINPGESRTLYLEKLTVPSSVKGTKIRVYRDLTTLVEQNKFYMTMFYMNRHFFRLDKDNFGDLYLTGSWERDFVQRFSYDACPRLTAFGDVMATAKSICAAWNSATRPIDLRELYDFGDDSTVKEMWVTYPGDVIPSLHPRYLVSAPMTSADFVSVFPGSYRFLAETKGAKSVGVKAGNGFATEAAALGKSLNGDNTLNSIEAVDCYSSPIWKTEQRAYCRKDSQEGCNRQQAQLCEAM